MCACCASCGQPAARVRVVCAGSSAACIVRRVQAKPCSPSRAGGPTQNNSVDVNFECWPGNHKPSVAEGGTGRYINADADNNNTALAKNVGSIGCTPPTSARVVPPWALAEAHGLRTL